MFCIHCLFLFKVFLLWDQPAFLLSGGANFRFINGESLIRASRHDNPEVVNLLLDPSSNMESYVILKSIFSTRIYDIRIFPSLTTYNSFLIFPMNKKYN